MKFNTFNSDVQILIQFAIDSGWDEIEVMAATNRLECAIKAGISGYSIPETVLDEDT